MNTVSISIAIATYNSVDTLGKTLKSIKGQDFPQNKIEILIIDGGSSDMTISLAKKYDCKILSNPKKEPVYAKHIAFMKSSGKYLMYLDSDEVLKNPHSLKLKWHVFKSNPKVKAIMPSGYKTPKEYSQINYYINEIGDPFSFFNYRLSQNAEFYIKLLSKRFRVISEDKNSVVLDFSNKKTLPIIELNAGGGMIDLEYAKSFPNTKKDPTLISFLFYHIVQKEDYIAITKNDEVIHYSSKSIIKYLKKIYSRVQNNTFNTTMGRSGFLGREGYNPLIFRFKKYFFIPYSFSLLFPLLDAVYFSFTRKKSIYLIHVLLCIYTSLLIIYFQLLKLMGIKPTIRSYGN